MNLTTFEVISIILGVWTTLIGGFIGLLYRWIALPMKRIEARIASQDREIELLKHEVAPNGDRDDDGRSLRAIVRSQARDLAAMKTSQEAGNHRLDRIEGQLGIQQGLGGRPGGGS